MNANSPSISYRVSLIAGLLIPVVIMLALTSGFAHGSANASKAAEQSSGHVSHSEETGEPPAAAPHAGPLIERDSTLYKNIRYVGKFHLLALHFPIVLLIGAALMQWIEVFWHRGKGSARLLLWAGVVGALVVALLGWMYAYDSVYFGDSERLISWHRWLGTGTAGLALLILLLRQWLGPKSLAAALTLCAILVGIAAHFGAAVVHGADFFTKG